MKARHGDDDGLGGEEEGCAAAKLREAEEADARHESEHVEG